MSSSNRIVDSDEEQSALELTGKELAILKSKLPVPDFLLKRITEKSRGLLPKMKEFRKDVTIIQWSRLLQILDKVEGKVQKEILSTEDLKFLRQFCAPASFGQYSKNEMLFLVLCVLFTEPQNNELTMFARPANRKVPSARKVLKDSFQYLL